MKYGTVLPHRTIRPITPAQIRDAAVTAEACGFADLWVTDNTMDHAYSFDPMVVLTYAAAATTRIRLGVSMLILNTYSPVHAAHQATSLDVVSDGRLTLGVSLGRTSHYHDFGVPAERPVRRLVEAVELLKVLWAEEQPSYSGQIFSMSHRPDEVIEHGSMSLKPVQRPHPPIWMGGMSEGALDRAARLSDGWMGNGGQAKATYGATVGRLRERLAAAGRDADDFPISKRIFMSVADTTRAARDELEEWFGTVYGNPALTDASGIFGTPAEVAEQVHELEALGANHLLLNPVGHFTENIEALAEALDITPPAG
jgi:alkanesulfonate monooxygenase SsuD/methylene tetrahydromethanopterin reductase-like flavin-dependent oxidoreductase (luciferase family)